MKKGSMLRGLLCATVLATAPALAHGLNAVTRATLGNGLRVVIVRDPLAPVVSVQTNYLVGSDETPPGFPGMAHATEHMMFRGSPGLTANQLAAVTANMGGAFDAETANSVTKYFFVVPAQDLDVALHIASIRMRAVDMAPKQWALERGAIEQEVAHDLSSPSFKFYTELVAHLFAGTPYAHTPLGTRPSFNATTAAMLKRFHDAWYVPNNAILVIAGDVDPAATLAEVRRLFASIPRRALPPRPAYHFRPVSAKTLRLPTDNPYGSVYLAYRMPGIRSKDYATAQVLANALASQRAALFGMGMDGTALFGTFFVQQLPRASLGAAVGIFPRGAAPGPLLKRMQAILAVAARHGVDPALVAAAKRLAIARLEFAKNSVNGLASAWSRALAVDGLSSPEAMKASIEAVTPAAVDALARRVFDPAHAFTAILTPQSSGKPVSSKGFGGPESFAANPTKPVVLPDWAARAFAHLPAPRSQLHPWQTTLPNGLKLVVQSESVSHTVQVVGLVRTNSDLESPRGQKGVSDVLDSMFQFGSAHLNRLQFQTALDAITAEESAGPEFSLAVPAKYFARGMALLADNELHPALTSQAFAIMRAQQAGNWHGEIHSPGFLNDIGLQRLLVPPGDPSLRYPTPERIRALTLRDVKAYYARVYRPDMTTIVVVGDVTPAQAMWVVAKNFGGWLATGPKPAVDYGAVPLNGPGSLHTPDKSAVQDSVQLAELVPVTRDSPERYALRLGNQVLGGGFYASWLYHDLREKSGLVYYVGTGFSLHKHRGAYRVSYGCDPDNVTAARSLILKDLKRMQDGVLPQSDLRRAKGILLRGIPLGESSFDQIGSRLLDYAAHGEPLDEDVIAGRRYRALTAAQVQQAYRRAIRLNGFAMAVKGPATTR
ncbi:MAG: M16 family metallopeptidase [Steroidobacteraceae bacterium]